MSVNAGPNESLTKPVLETAGVSYKNNMPCSQDVQRILQHKTKTWQDGAHKGNVCASFGDVVTRT